MAERFFVLTNVADHIQKIQEANIEFIVCELESPFTGMGIIIKEVDFVTVSQFCGFDSSRYTLLETDKEGVFVVSFSLEIDTKDPVNTLRLGYAQLVMGRLGRDEKTTENKIAEVRKKIETLSQEIYSLAKDLSSEEAKLAHFKEYALEMANRLMSEYDALAESADIDSIEVSDGVLSVITGSIVIDFGKDKINLGSYRIDIVPDEKGPKFYPTSDSQIRRLHGRNYIHPLIPADNQSFLDRFKPSFAQLMGEWNFSQVIKMAIGVLKNIEGDAKVRLVRWQR